MWNIKHRWAEARTNHALKDLRRDPHLAKDIGIAPLERAPRIDLIPW